MRLAILLVLIVGLVYAQRPAPSPSVPPSNAAVEKFSSSQHTITVAGKPLTYTATAGTLVLRNDAGNPTASMFFVATFATKRIGRSGR